MNATLADRKRFPPDRDLYEAAVQYGSQTRVAQEFGGDPSSISRRIRRYARLNGLPIPRGSIAGTLPRIAYTDDQVYEAAVRLGGQVAAADDLGISSTTVSRIVRRYAKVTGGQIPRSRPWGTGRLDYKARFLALDTKLDALAIAVATLTGMVETLLERPAASSGFVEFRPDHRRVADGGRRVRDQRRDARLSA